ncbi:MAG TPA: replication-associated recombination protein A [Gemmatimonadota bacterium]|nr:replication-associated recombination protein A [Gemmatimonadota bacterium]
MSGREPDLFGETTTPGAGRAPDRHQVPDSAPLASRMRPADFDGFVGQEKLVGPGSPLRELIERDRLPSLILWGPPGVGKTTLAHIVAGLTGAAFEPFSAVTEGIPRLREILATARDRRRATGRDTILFIDEIHRFNKAQQDALLPHVESGAVVLIGATTENPSFEVIPPLLSRSRVFVLEPLAPEAIAELCRRALADDRGLGGRGVEAEDEAIDRLAVIADGDARRALNTLETAADLAGDGGRITLDVVEAALQRRIPRYDKSGDAHFDAISALHKSVRGSDADGTLYWLARMLEAGEDPMYVARRLIRMAVEDVGLADSSALQITLAARDAYHVLGSPEGELALAEAAVYLAVAPKSNRIYRALGAARDAARETPAAPVPPHIRNAPTRLMRDLGHGEGYEYDHDWPGGVAPQSYLPEAVETDGFYRPGDRGKEAAIAERMRRIEELRAEARRREPSEPN